MITLAAHFPLTTTLPIAAFALLAIGWYFVRLGRSGVQPLRRRIRRWTMLLLACSVLAMTAGLSFVTAEDSPTIYAAVWVCVIVLVLLMLLTALLDILNNVSMHRSSMSETAEMTRQRLLDAVAEAQQRHQNGDL
ncbi:MAG: hypothetical protein ACR2GY_14155 [Phycisphaerales bacterium]